MSTVRSALQSGARGYWFYRNQGAFLEAGAVRPPRLLTDVSVIRRHDAHTGIQRVVRAVWSNLHSRSSAPFDVVPVFATSTAGYRFAPVDFLERENSESFGGATVRVQPGDKFLGLDLNAQLLPEYQKQLSSWRSAGATVHLVVYDLLPIHRPQWFTSKTVYHFKRWMEIVRNHCDQALCISDHVADELDSYLGSAGLRPKIGRIQLAGDIEASYPTRGVDQSIADAIGRISGIPAILMVGTIEPRKGYDLALAAFEHIWAAGTDPAPALVIAGKPGWQTHSLQERIRNHPEQGSRLFWLPNVSDEGLGQLYEACSAVFLASHAEGFGLPAIEAAVHARHALVRDLAVFREQELSNLSYFADDDPPALAGRILDLVRKSATLLPPAQLPCWDKCVASMLAEIGFCENRMCPAAPAATHQSAG